MKRILVERGRGAVTAFDEQDQVLAIYPATVGSSDTPTPAGHYTVNGVARNPTYSYRPDVNFQQGNLPWTIKSQSLQVGLVTPCNSSITLSKN